MEFSPAMIDVEDVSADGGDVSADRRNHQRIVVASAGSDSISLGHRQLADRFQNQIAVLGPAETGGVAVVGEASVLRIELEADVIVAVRLLALEVDGAGD